MDYNSNSLICSFFKPSFLFDKECIEIFFKSHVAYVGVSAQPEEGKGVSKYYATNALMGFYIILCINSI